MMPPIGLVMVKGSAFKSLDMQGNWVVTVLEDQLIFFWYRSIIFYFQFLVLTRTVFCTQFGLMHNDKFPLFDDGEGAVLPVP